MLKSYREKISDFVSIIVGLPSFIRLVMNSKPEGKAEFEKRARLVSRILIECDLLERAYAQGQKSYVLRSVAKINFLAKKTLLTDVYLFRLILSENRIIRLYPMYRAFIKYKCPPIGAFNRDSLSLGDFPKEIFVSKSIFTGRNFYEKRRIILFRPVLDILFGSQVFINEYRRTKNIEKDLVYGILKLRGVLRSYSCEGPDMLEGLVYRIIYKREMKRQASVLDAALEQDFEQGADKEEELISTSFPDELSFFVDELLNEGPDFNLINIYLAIAIHSLLESTQTSLGKYDELWKLMRDNFKRENPYRTRIPGGDEVTIFVIGDVLSHIGLSGTTSAEVSIKKISFVKNNGPIVKRILPIIKEFCEDKKIRNIPIIP